MPVKVHFIAKRQINCVKIETTRTIDIFCKVFTLQSATIYFTSLTIFRGMFVKELTIRSTAFQHNSLIPKKYTCDGQEVNPPLTIEGIPKEAKRLALLIEDPDASSGTFDHWVVWNIPPQTTKISENSVPGTEGRNSSSQSGYASPCPPSGTHRYFFKVYALDIELSLSVESTKKDLENAMQGHIVAKGELIGLYHR